MLSTSKEPLGYETRAQQEYRWPVWSHLLFWSSYFVFAYVGLYVAINPFSVLLWGRPGDHGVLICLGLGFVLSTVLLLFIYRILRRVRNGGWLGPLFGFFAPFPGFAIAYMM